MKIAAESEFYIRHFGAEDGIKRLKNMGYQHVTYTITNRYDEPFTTTWTEEELEEYFSPVRVSLQDNDMNMLFTTLATRVYSDAVPSSNAARKEMVIRAIKATAYMGCTTLALCPVGFYVSTEWEWSKKLTYEFFDEIIEVARQNGIEIAFINNVNCYGSRSLELLELARHYQAKIVIDPTNARYGGERVEKIVEDAGDKLLGFLINDTGRKVDDLRMPMMGMLDYKRIIELLKAANHEAHAVMMLSNICRRYIEFIQDESLVLALEKLFFKMNRIIAGEIERGDFHD